MHVYVVGMGMGTRESMTLQAQHALEKSRLIIGAARLLEALRDFPAEKLALTKASEIEDAVRASDADAVSIVVSGDTGFYSMSTIVNNRLVDLEPEFVPGVSSASYFLAKLGLPWQDACLLSAHGRSCNVAGAVRTHATTFLLTGGAAKAGDICRSLVDAQLGHVTVHAGENLGYPDERILSGPASDMAQVSFGDLTVLAVENEAPLDPPRVAPSLPDDAFVRGKVPMTKQEVRSLALAKLQLRSDSTVWDVGAGTGSVSVECALCAREGSVWSVERKPEAVDLIKRNARRFNCSNVFVVQGSAPDALEDLPAPDCVFVGGSGGRLEAILRAALTANPEARIVIAAIAVETLAEANRLMAELDMDETEIVQIAVSKGNRVGEHTLMRAANPVTLFCGKGRV